MTSAVSFTCTWLRFGTELPRREWCRHSLARTSCVKKLLKHRHRQKWHGEKDTCAIRDYKWIIVNIRQGRSHGNRKSHILFNGMAFRCYTQLQAWYWYVPDIWLDTKLRSVPYTITHKSEFQWLLSDDFSSCASGVLPNLRYLLLSSLSCPVIISRLTKISGLYRDSSSRHSPDLTSSSHYLRH